MSTTAVPSAAPVWEGVSAPKRALWRAEGMLSRHRDALTITALLLVAFGARAWIHRGLWIDEATSVAQAKMSFGRMLSYLRESDAHPPLFQAILWLDIRVFGTSELAVRLPSLVFGTALVPMLYGVGRDLFDRRTGLVAALVGALGPATVWYSQEARMYPMFMVFALAATWAQVRCVRNGSRRAWVIYTLATAALFWTQYLSVLHVLVQQGVFVYLVWKGRKTDAGRRLRNAWIRSTLVIALLIAPLMSFTFAQIAKSNARAATAVQASAIVDSGSPLYTAISSLASALVGYHAPQTMTKVNALWPLAMLGALMALGRGRSRATLLFVTLVLFPMACLFLLGLERDDAFELRYFAGAIPIIALLLGRAVTLLASTKKTMTFACMGLALMLLVALVDEQRDGGNARVYDFRSVLTQLESDHQPGDLMLYEPYYLHPTVHYYAPDFTSYPLVVGLASTAAPKRITIVGSLAFSDREISRNRIVQALDRLGQDRKLVEHIQRNHIEVWVFA